MIGSFQSELKIDIKTINSHITTLEKSALIEEEKEWVLSAVWYVNKQLVRDALDTQETSKSEKERLRTQPHIPTNLTENN